MKIDLILINSISTTKEVCIKDIVSIKNGLKNIDDWKRVDDCQYCDIKMNLIIYHEFIKMSQICEIQILLKWLLVSSMIENDYAKYKTKIHTLFTNSTQAI